MRLQLSLFLLLVLLIVEIVEADTLNSLKQIWISLDGNSSYWKGADFCNQTDFVGLICSDGRPVELNYIAPNYTSTAFIDPSIGNITSLASLTIKGVGGTIPQNLWQLRNLTHLNLEGNIFGGNVSNSLCDVVSLVNVTLSSNSLQGVIPSCIGGLTSLTRLDLSSNHLTGTIPPELIALPNLQFLNLSSNVFNGAISARNTSLSPLQVLDLSYNNLTSVGYIQVTSSCDLSGMVFPCYPELPLPTLCNVTHRSGGICNKTDYVGLTCRPLTINLHGQTFKGRLNDHIGDLVNLTQLSINFVMGGTIPSTIGHLVNLQSINFGTNALKGNIPDTICNLTKLTYLNLGTNYLSGSIPSCIHQLKGLTELYLDTNHYLNGSIPDTIGSLQNLTTADFSGNSFTGPIASSIGDMKSLQWIDMSSNLLTGPIPASVGRMSSLRSIYLYGNRLNGTIPDEMCQAKSLVNVDLHGNSLVGGTIPSCIGLLQNLSSLNLNQMNLTGTIPPSLMNLPNISFLSLNANNLNGIVPGRDAKLAPLSSLDLSGNELTWVEYVQITGNCFIADNPIACYPLLILPSQCQVAKYYPCNGDAIDYLYNSQTNLSENEAKAVQLISAVIEALLRNTSSFAYDTGNVSINLQSYNTSEESLIFNEVQNSGTSVSLISSITSSSRVSVALFIASFNPFVSIYNSTIYSSVTGVSVYDDRGRELVINGVSQYINISIGSVHSIPDGYHAVCQYWSETASQWSRDGLQTVMDGNVTICQTTHLTNFSIGIEQNSRPTEADDLRSAERDDKKRTLIVVICCAAGVALIIGAMVAFIIHRRRNSTQEPRDDTKMDGITTLIEKVADSEGVEVWRAVHNETTTVAVKKFDKDIHRMMEEATKLKVKRERDRDIDGGQNMHHPNIVQYLGQNLTVSPFIFQIGRDVARAMTYVAEQNL
ncbi:putative leucine-rich repeat receptor-like protein kinase, partial [Planoprotostelium fungivorum]